MAYGLKCGNWGGLANPLLFAEPTTLSQSSANLTKPMECSCVRQTELPHTAKLFADLVYDFERVADLYPWRPNSLDAIAQAARFAFPDDRRAAIVRALTPLNRGNASLSK